MTSDGLSERLLRAADELDEFAAATEGDTFVEQDPEPLRRQAALIRALVAEHEPQGNTPDAVQWCRICKPFDGEVIAAPCPTLVAVAACFLGASSSAWNA